MKIVRVEQLDSTSSYAARLAKAGEALPFAVIAKSQTAGRGRTGKTWASPQGGIYLSLAIDGQHLGERRQRCLPLLVATAAALWILQKFDLRVTIKWPNDLLFAGRKLAGILCESSFQGSDWGPTFLGIGINWLEAPDLADRQSTSLCEILGVNLPIEAISLAEELARSIHSHIMNQELMQDFARFAIENGQLWSNQQGDLVQLRGLSLAGHLQVRGIPSQVDQEITSIAHDFQWIYQQPRDYPLILADIGNTLVKLAIYRQSRSLYDESLCCRLKLNSSKLEVEEFLSKLRAEHLLHAWPVHCISVAPQSRDVLSELLHGLSLQLIDIPKRPVRVNFDQYKFSDLGIDRMALIEGARHTLAKRNLIIVSAGTCVTIEVLRGDAHYLGGFIWPGLQTKLDAMHQRAAGLPQLNLFDLDVQTMASAAWLGYDTKSAMLVGVLRETALALKALRQELELAWPSTTWEFVCTGGDGEVLSHLLSAPYIPQLIFAGMQLMVLGGKLE